MKFETSDKKQLEVDKEIMMCSEFFSNLIKDIPELDEVIPLSEVSFDVLVKIVEYLTFYRDEPQMTEDEATKFKSNNYIPKFDKEFFNVDQETLFEIITAANFLNCKRLLNSGCKTVAMMIKGRTPEEIRRAFGVEDEENK